MKKVKYSLHNNLYIKLILLAKAAEIMTSKAQALAACPRPASSPVHCGTTESVSIAHVLNVKINVPGMRYKIVIIYEIDIKMKIQVYPSRLLLYVITSISPRLCLHSRYYPLRVLQYKVLTCTEIRTVCLYSYFKVNRNLTVRLSSFNEIFIFY